MPVGSLCSSTTELQADERPSGKRGSDRMSFSFFNFSSITNPVEGASEYFKRTENIAGVKVHPVSLLVQIVC